jgi:hypothetical protein
MLDSDLCENCYQEWVKGSDKPKSIPSSVQILEKLEHDLQPIRIAVWKLVPLGAECVFDALTLLKPSQGWFEEKLKAYRDWGDEHNENNRF